MIPPPLLVLALAVQSALHSFSTVKYPAFATRIERLFHTITTTDDDKLEAAARNTVKQMYAAHGLFTIADVGDEPSYEFIVMLESDSIPYDQRIQILEKVKAGASRGDIPADAAIFYAARLRLDQINRQAASNPPSNPALRGQIERLYKMDQQVRQQQGFDAAEMQQVDRDNSAAVQKILDQFGVPTFSLVGPEAAGDFILMVQHQPAGFRARVLPQLKQDVDKGEADPDSFAKVYDRSQFDLGKPQLYGEQLICNAGEKMHEAPIEDEAHVNDRRAQFGLLRVEIYARLVAELMPQFCPPATHQ
jgi:hypothetical protein